MGFTTYYLNERKIRKDYTTIRYLYKMSQLLNEVSRIKDMMGIINESPIIEPSKEAVDNICNAKKFCKAQGKITFGQLKSIVDTAIKNRIVIGSGKGAIKIAMKVMPFFFPQVALAGGVLSGMDWFNKLFKPTITNTKSYKTWWGKTMLKVLNTAEAEINLGDPLQKIFFVSDGLLTMLSDENKIKFALYVADIASEKPDDEEVPEYFVENELRNWINQKFLIEPPLPQKEIQQ